MVTADLQLRFLLLVTSNFSEVCTTCGLFFNNPLWMLNARSAEYRKAEWNGKSHFIFRQIFFSHTVFSHSDKLNLLSSHPLIPVMRNTRLPLILVQLTNLSMLLESTVWAVCKLAVPIPSHAERNTVKPWRENIASIISMVQTCKIRGRLRVWCNQDNMYCSCICQNKPDSETDNSAYIQLYSVNNKTAKSMEKNIQ